MIVKVHYDTSGTILGFYPGHTAYASIPKPNIGIPEETWLDAVANPGKYSIQDGDIVAAQPWPPAPSLADAQNRKLSELSSAAATAYVGGFYSSASGTRLWYDSDADTQNVLNRQFLIALTAPDVYSSTVFFAGLPAGVTPVRARPNAADPDSAKTVQLIDAAQMVKLGTDLAAAWAGVKGTLWGLQAKVYAATTAEVLAAINWPATSN